MKRIFLLSIIALGAFQGVHAQTPVAVGNTNQDVMTEQSSAQQEEQNSRRKTGEGVVSGYHAVEHAVVSGYDAVEHAVVNGYGKMQDTIVGGFTRISDRFVDKYLRHEGETLEQAKARIKQQESELNNPKN